MRKLLATRELDEDGRLGRRAAELSVNDSENENENQVWEDNEVLIIRNISQIDTHNNVISRQMKHQRLRVLFYFRIFQVPTTSHSS